MSIFCIRGGQAEAPFPMSSVTPNLFDYSLFYPGIIHGTPDIAYIIALSDSHTEMDDDHNQFDILEITPGIVRKAVEEDPSAMLDYFFENCQHYSVDSTENDFYAIAEVWDKAINKISVHDLVVWAEEADG